MHDDCAAAAYVPFLPALAPAPAPPPSARQTTPTLAPKRDTTRRPARPRLRHDGADGGPPGSSSRCCRRGTRRATTPWRERAFWVVCACFALAAAACVRVRGALMRSERTVLHEFTCIAEMPFHRLSCVWGAQSPAREAACIAPVRELRGVHASRTYNTAHACCCSAACRRPAVAT